MTTSRHDYFASRAPDAIPAWFVLTNPTPIPPPVDREAFDAAWDETGKPRRLVVKDALRSEARFDPGYWAAVTKALNERAYECGRVDLVNQELRYFAWRVYYADQMVAAIPEDK